MIFSVKKVDASALEFSTKCLYMWLPEKKTRKAISNLIFKGIWSSYHSLGRLWTVVIEYYILHL